MQKLIIKNFGPVKRCDIEIKDFMVLTGHQASGKSTVAKAVFFFQRLKDVLLHIVRRDLDHKLISARNIKDSFVREIRKLFVQSFGIEYGKKNTGQLEYIYENGTTVSVNLEEQENIAVGFGTDIDKKLNDLSEMIGPKNKPDIKEIQDFIDGHIFGLDHDFVYIPAGRSLLTMLSSQINYLYAVMDDQQKNTIDYCTQCYLEEVLRIREFFKTSPQELLNRLEKNVDYSIDRERTEAAIGLIQKILHGEYRNEDGEERLYFDDDQSVKMNYSSSGQQEAVWITNILFYHMLGRRNVSFIIEEPESHLYPDTQKAMVEFISLVKNGKNKVIITTHSPYVLGSINNLLYADKIADDSNRYELDKIISEKLWLDYESIGAYYLEDGGLKNICNDEYKDIDHDVIDGASRTINDDYDKMVDIKIGNEGEGDDT